jgi:fructoselysine 6-kinase
MERRKRMKRAIALADNCIDVYYKLDRYYLTGNSIDFAFNYKDMGGDVTEMTILGNDVFALALAERLKEKNIPLRVIKEVDRPTGMATMDIVNGDKIHVRFAGNAMEEIEFSEDDLNFIKGFDIVYSERWAKIGRYIKSLRKENQIWVYDFSKRLELPGNDEILPYLDYAFFSYDKEDDYIAQFMKKTRAKGAKCVIAMLGEHGSMAYDGVNFYKEPAEKVTIVNTVGAGDSYIAAFAYGLSLGESVPECMKRGKDRATRIIQQFNPYI